MVDHIGGSAPDYLLGFAWSGATVMVQPASGCPYVYSSAPSGWTSASAASSACARRGRLRQFRLGRLPSAVDVQPGTTDAPDPSAIVDKQHYVTLSDGEGLRRTCADPPICVISDGFHQRRRPFRAGRSAPLSRFHETGSAAVPDWRATSPDARIGHGGNAGRTAAVARRLGRA